jgi:hypothetical protein
VTRSFRAGTVATSALWLAVAVQASRPEPAASLSDPVQPPPRLSDTGLYRKDQPGAIDPGNRPFAPQYPLWSDGLTKRRWIQLPPNAAIDASDEHAWKFPVGTRFWKEFSRGDRKVETRFLWKASRTGWVFASYVWNETGTEALLAPHDGVFSDIEVAPGRRHFIPSRTDCAACHGSPTAAAPLGFNALQLSSDRDPNAIHGEALQPGMLTLETLARDRTLTSLRAELLTSPPRIRTNSAATRTVLGYLAANCSMCHNGRGEIAALGPVIRHRDLLEDGDAVARTFLNQTTRWQLPGTPDGSSVLVHPGIPENSAVLARMRSRSPSSQMPPLGTVVRDQAAVDRITRWIASIR